MHAPSYSADILYWHLRVVFEQERLDIRLAIFGMVAPAALGFHTACRLHVNSTTVVKLYVMLLVVYETESNVAMILSPFAAWENGSCVYLPIENTAVSFFPVKLDACTQALDDPLHIVGILLQNDNVILQVTLMFGPARQLWFTPA